MSRLRLRYPALGPGPHALLLSAACNLVVWVAARPPGQPAGRFLGELCGVEAVLLLMQFDIC